MAQRAEWAVQKVVESAGIRMDEATDETLFVARCCLERCYYIDRAANELMFILKGPLRGRYR